MRKDVEIVTNLDTIDFGEVSEILNFYGLSDYGKEMQKQIFQNSYAVVFLKKDNMIIGVGRAISDGISQAAIYNIAVRDSYRGQGYGKLIVEELIKQLSDCNIILYTHPKHIGLYEHWGFSRLNTAYARYVDETHYREEGFID